MTIPIFAYVIVFKCSWEYALYLGAFLNNCISKLGGAGANRVYCGDSNLENSWKIVVAYGCALDKNRASRAMQSLQSSVYLFKFTKRVELKFGSVSKGSF